MRSRTPWISEGFAVATRSHSHSAEEIAARSEPVAESLSREGVQPGDVVALIMPVGAESIIALHALRFLQAVALPLSPRLPEAAIDQRLTLTQCRVVLRGLDPTQIEIRDAPPRLLSKAMNDADSEDRPALIVFTSGSMGAPRPAVLTLGNLHHSARNANRALGFHKGDSWALSLGLDHVAGHGVLWRAMAAGGTVIVPDPEERLEDLLPRSGPTHLSLVPTQLFRLMNDPRAVEALRAAKCILMGGGPIADSLVRDAIDAGLPLAISYGMTETAGLICAAPPGSPFEDLLTSGRPLTPDTVRVAPDGEILVRGATTFAGYLDERGAIDRPAINGDWFPTGDLGRLDETGRLRVNGRRDNRFKCGGENVQPEAIERAMAALPGIAECIVVPVASAEYGFVPVAFVHLRDGADKTEAAWRESLGETLPRFIIPRRFLDWPPQADPASLKIDRTALIRLADSLFTGNLPRIL